MAHPHKWSPISYRSSAGQRKFTGQRPTFYRCATQPTNKGEGGLGRNSQRLQGQRPWSWVRGQSTFEAESFEAFAHLKKAQKAVQGGCLSIFQYSRGGEVLPSRRANAPMPIPMATMGPKITFSDIFTQPPDNHASGQRNL